MKNISTNLNRRVSITKRSLMSFALLAGLSAVPLHAQNYRSEQQNRAGEATSSWEQSAHQNQRAQSTQTRSYLNDSTTRNSAQRSNNTDRSTAETTGKNWAQDEEGWSMNDSSNLKGETRLQGTVDGFRKVNLSPKNDPNDEHSFVRVRLENGQNKIVCLGTRVDVSDLDLQSGEEITVVGKPAKIDGENVIVAERIEHGDNSFRISKEERPEIQERTSQNRQNQTSNRASGNQDQFHSRPEYRDSNQSQQVRNNDRYDRETRVKDTTERAGAYWSDDKGWSDNSDQSPQETRLDGTIDGFRVIRIGTDGDQAYEQAFVRIRLKSGDSKIVSLGKRVALDELGLESGEFIAVTGKEKTIDGQNVLVAEQINYGEDIFQIKKEDRPKADNQQSSRDSQNRLRDELSDDRQNTNLQNRQSDQAGSESLYRDSGSTTNQTRSIIERTFGDHSVAGAESNESR